jgi:hypothetical protein
MYCPNPECPDFKDTGVHGEYVDTIWQCPLCGARLVAQLPDERPAESVADEVDPSGFGEDDLQSVGIYAYRQDAELASSFLNAHGIPAFVARATEPMGQQLLVPASQVHAAMTLLEEFDRNR